MHVAYRQRLVLPKRVQVEGWHARVELFRKTVWKIMTHRCHRFLVGIHVYVAKRAAERPQVVQSGNVVVVFVGKQHGVNLPELQWHQLHTDVRSAVNQHACMLCFNHRRGAIAEVFRAFAAANLTAAADDRHAVGCACT